MRTKLLIPGSLLLFSAILCPAACDRGVGSIELSANPSAILADGKSVCTVTVQVRDREGRFVADGTEVRVSASLGVIEESGLTSAGVARVKLVSADIPGTCVVTATWVEGQAVAQINVEFGDAPSLPQGPDYLTVTADKYLAYSVDYKVLEALGNVRIRCRTLDLAAEEAQINLERGRVVARGEGRASPIRIRTTGGDVVGDMFACDLSGSEGLLLSAERGRVQKVNVSKSIPEISDQEASYMPEDMSLHDLSDSSILVKAREATVFPNQKIQFKRASVYVDGKRVVSLPLYVLWLTGAGPEEGQYVGYSTGGVTLNLPVYYSLSSSSSGALLVRHGDSTGWGDYGQKPGWFVDLRQKYSTERSDGSLLLSQVTRADWGAHFYHSQDLGRQTRGYVYMDYPSHRDFFGSVSINKSFEAFDVGLSLDRSDLQEGEDSTNADIFIQMRARPLGKSPFRYTLSTRSAYSTYSDMRYEVKGNVYSSPIRLADKLSLRTSLGLGYLWGSRISGLSTLGAAVLEWRISEYSGFGLSYRFADRASVYTSYAGKQTLSATCVLSDGKKWRASIYAIKGLDYPTANVFGDLTFRLSPDWRFTVSSTFNEIVGRSYRDLELSVGKMVGSRELIAVWSQSQRKIMFELGSGGF
ncbi:MAG TPA: invasin domain 3-containing protein [Armatimonadota bacterium]|nr:invasin domain 3-containing protein [Armatimonadota bacterium]